MRVVFLTHNFPRHPGDVSGSFLAVLARALIARGHRIQVIAPSDGGDVGSDELDGVPVRRVRYAAAERERLAYRGTMAEAARSPAGALIAWSLVRAMRRAARAEVDRGAELIHAHWWIPAGLAAPHGTALVVTLHGTDAALLERSRPARLLGRHVLRRASVVTAVSDSAAEKVRRWGGRVVDQAHVLPMPVETSWYGVPGTGGGGLVAVARLTAQKRIDLALRALPLIPLSGVALTIVGDGPERSRLQALASTLGIADRVRFLGALPPPRVAGVLALADVAIFPALAEGFGLAAAEALMMGVPVVACRDGGGVLAVVPDHGAGRRVEPSPAAIAGAVTDLLGDAHARAAALAAGREWQARLNPAHAAEVCEGWYREAARG